MTFLLRPIKMGNSNHKEIVEDFAPIVKNSKQKEENEINLPQDTLEVILDYLSPKNILQFRLVSKRFDNVVQDLEIWKKFLELESNSAPIQKKSWLEVYILCKKRKIECDQIISEKMKNLSPPPPLPSCGLAYIPENNQIIEMPKKHSFSPIGGFQSHPMDSDFVSITFKVLPKLEMTSETIKTLEYNFKDMNLSEDFFESAIMRYDCFMKLKAKYPDMLLIPTIDIEMVWCSHLIRPSMYHKDCKKLYGKIIDHHLVSTSSEFHLLGDAIQQTSDLWFENYKSDYGASFDVEQKYEYDYHSKSEKRFLFTDLSEKKSELMDYKNWENPLSISVSELKKDRFWFPNFLLEQQKPNSTTLVKDYEKFMYLVATNKPDSNEMYHPSYKIDLMWHSHMLHPLDYIEDCKNVVGFFVDHLPWPEEIDTIGFEKIKTIWKKEYGKEME
jgi:hypothetical protein